MKKKSHKEKWRWKKIHLKKINYADMWEWRLNGFHRKSPAEKSVEQNPAIEERHYAANKSTITTSENRKPVKASTKSQDSTINKIGICLSGGGFRAVGFHIGTLEYLERLGLLGNIRQISTVSGGTFVGAKWVLSLIEKVEFQDFFTSYYAFNENVHLLDLAFKHLHGPAPATHSGRNTFIVGLANVHADTIAKDPTGKPYLFKTILDAELPFDEIIFNTTELRNGLAFAFRKSRDPLAPIGNSRLQIDPEEANQIRVADIITASSCFPGGFEALAFPGDFVWPEGKLPPKIRAQFSRNGATQSVAFADGCIYDNQGIETLLFSEKSHAEDLDMIIISDTDPHVEEFYPIPPPARSGSSTSVGSLLGLSQLAGMVVALGTIFIASIFLYRLFTGGLCSGDLLVFFLPIFVGCVAIFGMAWAYWVAKSIVAAGLPNSVVSLARGLKATSLRQVIDMVKLRMTILLSLNENYYGKRIRELVYSMAYSDPRYQGKLVSNRIFELIPGQPWSSDLPREVPKPSRELQAVARIAATCKLNLWFDHPYDLPCLVAAGQATLCYNLMEWVAKQYGQDSATYPKDIRILWDQLLQDWKRLCAEPYSLLQERLPDKTLIRPPL